MTVAYIQHIYIQRNVALKSQVWGSLTLAQYKSFETDKLPRLLRFNCRSRLLRPDRITDPR